ncbi:MAG: hypothetical protein AAB478_05230 [Patescibacteria group bacterium]
MQTVILVIIACLLGFYGSKYFTTPIVKNGEKRPNRLPEMKLGRVEVLPRFGIMTKNSRILLHHWVTLPLLIAIALLLYDNIVHLTTFKVATGATVGSILQGLTYPDRFKFKHPHSKK